MKLPDGMYARVVDADPRGRVEAIAVRPRRREPVVQVDSWTPGDDADHAKHRGKRAITLISGEQLDAMAALLARPVDFLQTRRNLLVRGINLSALDGRRFRVGELVLEGTEPCHPCNRMVQTFGADGYTAMLGHGGLCARIVEGGTIRVGDELSVLP